MATDIATNSGNDPAVAQKFRRIIFELLEEILKSSVIRAIHPVLVLKFNKAPNIKANCDAIVEWIKEVVAKFFENDGSGGFCNVDNTCGFSFTLLNAPLWSVWFKPPKIEGSLEDLDAISLIRIVEALIAVGCDPQEKNKKGETALASYKEAIVARRCPDISQIHQLLKGDGLKSIDKLIRTVENTMSIGVDSSSLDEQLTSIRANVELLRADIHRIFAAGAIDKLALMCVNMINWQLKR